MPKTAAKHVNDEFSEHLNGSDDEENYDDDSKSNKSYKTRDSESEIEDDITPKKGSASKTKDFIKKKGKRGRWIGQGGGGGPRKRA